jgi:hypothetical protein
LLLGKTKASGAVWSSVAYKHDSRTGDASVGTMIPFVGLGLLGAAVILGFRVGEIVDLWSKDHVNDAYAR